MTALLPGAPCDTKGTVPKAAVVSLPPSQLLATGLSASCLLCPLLELSFLISLKHAQIWLLVNYVNRTLCFKTTFYPLISAVRQGGMEQWKLRRLSRCHKPNFGGHSYSLPHWPEPQRLQAFQGGAQIRLQGAGPCGTPLHNLPQLRGCGLGRPRCLPSSEHILPPLTPSLG